MKLHTRLTGPDIGNALLRAQGKGLITSDVHCTVFTPGRSMTHPRSFRIQLGTYVQDSLPAGYTDQHGRNLRVRRIRGGNHGEARWAATWHEWGWLIAEIFAADPQARWGTNPARSRHPQGYFSPEDFHAKTGGQFRTRPAESGAQVMPTTLKAYREDGTEVLPGDKIDMAGTNHPFTYRAALTASNDTGTDGMIAVDGYPDMFASPFGLTVRAVPADDEPKWEVSDRFPEWDRALFPGPADHQGTVFPDLDSILGTGSSDRSELPVSLDTLLSVVDDNRAGLLKAQRDLPEDGASSERDAYLGALEKLADVVRDKLTPVRGGTDALAAQADRDARTTAPPVPGVTQNTGHTVYAVLGHQPASPGLRASWLVAAADDRGEHVTWTAYASDDGSGRLHYDSGHYHSPGLGTDSEALLDLAERADVFRRLTELSSGPNSRTAFQDSHAKVLDELAGTWGVGRARVRAGLLEAAALGYARISWHHGGERRDYGIRYDRYRCTFSWDREH